MNPMLSRSFYCFDNLQVNMIKDDGQVLHFNNPKVQASLAANTFAINGHADNKRKLKD